MFPRPDDIPRRSRLSLRIAVLGGVAVALFAVLFFRLWNLQVLDGGKYLAEAQNNRTREYRVLAPRGDILARNGEVLVENRTSLALLLSTDKLPDDPAEEKQELTELGQLAHMSLKKVRRTIREQEEVAAGAPITLRRDVGYDLVYYIEENQRRFPGVSVERVFVRRYPDGSRAAHVVGSVGEISEDELKEPRYKNIEPGDEVGQSGAEYVYDKYLRGTPGVTRIQVNALGQPTPGGQLVSEPPTPGDNLVLTLDPAVQEAGEAALAERGLPGAFVSMNIDNGEILGMGSYPTYDPAIFTHPMTQKQYDALVNDPIAAPILNRATESSYPTGSTYKIITALAALEAGEITPSSTINDNGFIELAGLKFQNAGGVSYGPLTLVPALQVSSDVFFYELGLKMWDKNYLQHWSHELGIARPTGFDLGNESEGLVPSKKWRDELFANGETDRPWSAGDNVQLATGQGDLQTNPLQLAIAYATLGTGGTVPTPHVAKEVEDAAGRVIKEFKFKTRRHVKIDPGYRQAILEGLHEAAQVPPGTAAGVFGGFPVPIAGKTGTAERPGHADQSWFAALAPYPDPRIVTIVTIEEGGFGAESAAPAALSMLEAYFNKQATEVTSSGGAE
ncbi:MAG TPA: penicillin-binding protein 2 [Solirubrobacterales bacterium]|nr:penicillin-binding protein 2 [Solirubrobacterales bacterium]